LIDRALPKKPQISIVSQQRELDPGENIDLRKDEVQARSEPLVDPVAHIVVKIFDRIGVLAGHRFARHARRLSMLGTLQNINSLSFAPASS